MLNALRIACLVALIALVMIAAVLGGEPSSTAIPASLPWEVR